MSQVSAPSKASKYLLIYVLDREFAHKVTERACFILQAVMDHLRIHCDVKRQRCIAFLVSDFVGCAQTQWHMETLS